MTFPQTPLDVRTELLIGVVWTDITEDVYTRSPITIERGMKDEGTRVDPSRCSLVLNNRDGVYSPRNPMSPYFGLIGRNTPLRVSVQGDGSYLRLDGVADAATTPDTAVLDIVGDLDLRIEATANWQTSANQSLIGKWISAVGQRGYLLRIGTGTAFLHWSTTGSNSVFASWTLPRMPHRAALRATLDVNNGAGGSTATLYTAPTMDGPWEPIGDPVVTAGVTSIFAGTAPLMIAPTGVSGDTPMGGQVHRAEVRSGIDGTVVASPDLRALTPGATGWTDSAGRTWSLIGAAEITDRQYRFVGEVSSWPTRWDVSGKDVWVPIEASGVLRRMGQGKKALGSTLLRRIPAFEPLAYWPCEDDDGAGQAYSPIEGVSPLVVSSGWRFGQDTTLAGSAALPSVEAGSTMRGLVPPPAVTPTEWSVHMVYAVDEAPVTDAVFLSWRATGTVQRWQIVQRSGNADIQGYDGTGTLVVDQAVAIGADVFEGWQRFHFRLSTSGGTVTWRLDWTNIGGPAGGIGGTYSGSTGRVAQIDTQFGASVTGLRVGHIAVLPTALTTAYSGADHGFAGDTALARIFRLANEESGQVTVTASDGSAAMDSERMGPQRPDTLLSLLEEAAATDGGILFERREAIALHYRDRATLYNQLVTLALDYTAEGEVPPPLEPVPDDQRLRNDVTISRSGGSSGRAVLETGPLSVQSPPDGVGPYDEALTLSLYTDAQPARIAQWRMHLGTWDEERYPVITVWLHAAPHLIADVLDMDIGDRLAIDNTPAWLPPGLIDQHMRGYVETLGLYEWALAMNCSPAGPWTVGVLEDPVLGKADTEGSELVAAVDSDDTFLTVATTAGPVWTSDLAELPFDITVGGEVVTALDITGSPGDRFDRSVPSGWGTSTSGQAWTTSGGSAADYSVQGG